MPLYIPSPFPLISLVIKIKNPLSSPLKVTLVSLTPPLLLLALSPSPHHSHIITISSSSKLHNPSLSLTKLNPSYPKLPAPPILSHFPPLLLSSSLIKLLPLFPLTSLKALNLIISPSLGFSYSLDNFFPIDSLHNPLTPHL